CLGMTQASAFLPDTGSSTVFSPRRGSADNPAQASDGPSSTSGKYTANRTGPPVYLLRPGRHVDEIQLRPAIVLLRPRKTRGGLRWVIAYTSPESRKR